MVKDAFARSPCAGCPSRAKLQFPISDALPNTPLAFEPCTASAAQTKINFPTLPNVNLTTDFDTIKATKFGQTSGATPDSALVIAGKRLFVHYGIWAQSLV